MLQIHVETLLYIEVLAFLLQYEVVYPTCQVFLVANGRYYSERHKDLCERGEGGGKLNSIELMNRVI